MDGSPCDEPSATTAPTTGVIGDESQDLSAAAAAATTTDPPAKRCRRPSTLNTARLTERQRVLCDEWQVYVAPSTIPGAGFGLFTRQPRRSGDFLASYTGRLLSARKNQRTFPWAGGSYMLYIDARHALDAADPTCGVGRFANTARGDNVQRSNNARYAVDKKRKSADIVATRCMQANDEIFVAYGLAYRM